jgi:DNA-binding beta-propeller fold protein YncE
VLKVAIVSRIFVVALLLAGLTHSTPAPAQAPPLLATWIGAGPYGFGRPWHLDFDASGNVYVADAAALRVFVLDPGGGYVTSWSCPALAPLDFSPRGIAVGVDGRVYVTTPYPNGPPPFYLTAYTTTGAYLGPVGTLGSGPGQLGQAMDVAVDVSGNLYVMDWTNFRVDVLTNSGGHVTEWGSYGSGPGQFHGPLAIAVSPDGLVYVTDDDNQRVEVFTTGGAFVRQWGSCGNGPGQFAGPWGIALDATGNVYVADAANNRIQVFTGSGEFLTQWGTLGTGPGQFYKPIGVGVGPDGRIYVADTWNSRIQVFGSLPTPTKSSSWGAIKALYR